MKQLLFFLYCLLIMQCCLAQKDTHHYDSLARKAIERLVAHPDCDACDSAGVVLLKLFQEKDSLQIKLLYSSDIIYSNEINGFAARRLNKRYKGLFENKYSVLIPVYFRYEKADRDARK